MWLYGSGFPKSMNVGLAIDKKNGVDNRTGNIVKGVGTNNTNSMKNGLGESQEFAPEYEERKATNEWAGWGTALKPSFEPIIVARKPFKGSLVDNIIENGVGGINIDECRVETTEDTRRKKGGWQSNGYVGGKYDSEKYNAFENREQQGRFPANTILTYDETDFDEVCGGFPYTKTGSRKAQPQKDGSWNAVGIKFKMTYACEGSEGSASRYFYCAKASKKDRDEGLDEFEEKQVGSLAGGDSQKEFLDDVSSRFRTIKKNTHPTVKPTTLMQYLVRLVTPNGGTILDPFNGSGSTGKAVMYENKERNKNYKYIGIELTEEYLPIAKARIEYVCKLNEEKLKEMQTSIFDYLESKGE
jgi:site-specific DNA-methyltransferase (adenine-specific)